MQEFFAYTVQGLFLAAAYAIAASGLVLTYTTTRVFNLAHGATSMVMAYLYWELRDRSGVPTWLALLLVVVVIAPVFGLVLERLVMRGLRDAPVSVSLVVTIGVFVLLVGLAQQFWPPVVTVDYLFGSAAFTVGATSIPYHYLLTVGIALALAVALFVLLNRTRTGAAMRAATDNTDLLRLFGASADRVSMLSWALGSALAALAGVLLVAYTGLDYYTLTFLVIASFAAAMLGRLASLPLTFLGALVLGLANAYLPAYIQGGPLIQTGLQSSLPTFLLFATLLFVPQVRLRVGQIRGQLAAAVPAGRQSTIAAVGVFGVGLLALTALGEVDALRFGTALAYGMAMLSLVLLTGYGGYVSLAQFTFVGVGATVAAKADSPSLWVLLVAVVVSAAIGALVALPVLRLTGLYLALATLAFGQLMDKLVFQADFLFGFGGTLHAQRVSMLGYHFTRTGPYVGLMLLVFLLLGLALLALRRGPTGRLLIALRDSPAAASTLGLNQRWFRIAVFSASAGMAGLGGALLAGLQGTVSPVPFQTLQSLPLLLVAVVAGVTTVSGAFVGGVLLMLLPVVQATVPSVSGLVFLVIGVGAILLGRDPNGLINVLFRGLRDLEQRTPLPPQWVDAVRGRRADPEDSGAEGQVARHGAA